MLGRGKLVIVLAISSVLTASAIVSGVTMLKRHEIPLELIAVLRVDPPNRRYHGPYSKFAFNSENLWALEKEFSVDLPELKWGKEGMVVSYGRRIKRMTYRRIDRVPLFGPNGYFAVREEFEESFDPFALYVYKAPRVVRFGGAPE